MDIIIENIWNILFVTIPIALSIIAFFRRRSRNKSQKILSYEVLTNSQLLDDRIKENEVEVSFRGKKLDNLSIVIFEIINTGKLPIPKEDFEKSIRIYFGEQVEIVSAKIIGKSPDYLEVDYKSNLSDIIISPLLLNRFDSFKFKVLITGLSDIIAKSEIRIKGIKNMNEIKEPMEYSYTTAFGFVLIVIGGIIFGVYEPLGKEPMEFSEFKFKNYITLLIGIIVYIIGTFQTMFQRGVYIFNLNRTPSKSREKLQK